jgi:hypothetical protein
MNASLPSSCPGVCVKDANTSLLLRIDDGLRQIGPHTVQAINNGRNRPEISLLANDRETRMLNLTASVAVDFLPMVSKKAKLRRSSLPKKMLLKNIYHVGVRVLVLVNQYYRVLLGQDAPELGVFHQSDGENENVVVMYGDATVVDASMPKLVLNGTSTEVANFGDPIWPVLKARESRPKLLLKPSDERPTERMDRIAINEWAPVGPGVNLVLCHISEGDACNPLMPLRHDVLIAVYKEMERLYERVGLSGTGAGFNEKALLSFQAAIYFGEGFTAGLFRRVQLFHDLSHFDPTLLRRRRGTPPGGSPRPHRAYHKPPAISIHRGYNLACSNQFNRWRI